MESTAGRNGHNASGRWPQASCGDGPAQRGAAFLKRVMCPLAGESHRCRQLPRDLPRPHPGIPRDWQRLGGEVRGHHELHQVAAGPAGGLLQHRGGHRDLFRAGGLLRDRRGHGDPAAGAVGAIDVTGERAERADGCLIERASYLDLGHQVGRAAAQLERAPALRHFI
jgi:hypothetical protein